MAIRSRNAASSPARLAAFNEVFLMLAALCAHGHRRGLATARKRAAQPRAPMES